MTFLILGMKIKTQSDNYLIVPHYFFYYFGLIISIATSLGKIVRV